MGIFVGGVSVGTGIHNFTSRLAVVLCSGLHLLQRGIFLMRGEDYTYLCTGKFLECNQGPCWFSKGVAIGSPSKSMSSLTLSI